jgi:hypothetical protein
MSYMTDYGRRNYCIECNWAASTTDYPPAQLTHRLITHMAEHDGHYVIAEPIKL